MTLDQEDAFFDNNPKFEGVVIVSRRTCTSILPIPATLLTQSRSKRYAEGDGSMPARHNEGYVHMHFTYYQTLSYLSTAQGIMYALVQMRKEGTKCSLNWKAHYGQSEQ